jgi:hypothetical protein
MWRKLVPLISFGMTIKRLAKKSDGGDKLPAELAKNAAAQAKRKKDDLAQAARDDIALIQLRQKEIVSSFYDIGEALIRLGKPGVPESLEHAGFAELVQKELDISVSAANDLVDIAKGVRRTDALRWGQKKSLAMAQLAKATPDFDTPESIAKKGTITLSSGRVLDTEAANANELLAAAKEERAATRGARKPRRGVTTTRDERSFAERLQKALRDAGVVSARVHAIARAGAVADLKIERLPIDQATTLRRVLGKVS